MTWRDGQVQPKKTGQGGGRAGNRGEMWTETGDTAISRARLPLSTRAQQGIIHPRVYTSVRTSLQLEQHNASWCSKIEWRMVNSGKDTVVQKLLTDAACSSVFILFFVTSLALDQRRSLQSLKIRRNEMVVSAVGHNVHLRQYY